MPNFIPPFVIRSANGRYMDKARNPQEKSVSAARWHDREPAARFLSQVQSRDPYWKDAEVIDMSKSELVIDLQAPTAKRLKRKPA